VRRDVARVRGHVRDVRRPRSPITQTFGLGLAAPPTDDDLAAIEAFYRERGADVFHEVSPLVDPSVVARLGDRGYRPAELTSVMHQPIVAGAYAEPVPSNGARDAARDDAPRARPIAPHEAELWAETAARGWETEGAWLGDFIRAYGRMLTTSEGATCFVAEAGGEAIAAGALMMHGGVAILGGASTTPEWRGRGAQAALLRARLRHAAGAGCDLALMGASPGSASQRNAERQGFRIAYTRIKWRLHA
jgi:GNAT superfamily N-acetyltransferase